MQDETFNYAIVVGRFQHIHIGHERLINIALKLCSKVLILISTSENEGTIKNPYTYEYRKSLIEIIYKEEIRNGRIIIEKINEPKTLDVNWGKYVLNSAKKITGQYPDCIVYGKDKNIFKCFPREVVKKLNEVYVNRNQVDISATKLREFLLNDNKAEWMKYVDSSIYNKYDELREILNKIYCKKN